MRQAFGLCGSTTAAAQRTDLRAPIRASGCGSGTSPAKAARRNERRSACFHRSATELDGPQCANSRTRLLRAECDAIESRCFLPSLTARCSTRTTTWARLAGRSARCSEKPRLYYTAGAMKLRKLLKEAAEIAEPFRVSKGEGFRLKDFDPGNTNGLKDKEKARETLENGVKLLAHMQEKLYAQDRWALLVIFQAMDAAGKDGAIKHVMSGVNPQGCDVHSFKAPSAEELD